ncbi:MAG TPA: arsenate reductase (glutaredoxin) [Saprospiraceae bacterium]|nr:arsenate reductase (glutaredoxin) [Saprospiraceae bacterium]HRO07613.1 arsenate reductase (glutaredoxin) [Saprospiraceae bacterium]HRP40896.1 arsenate reductase (glutaredoxin) [Saprospiraceae bacterium]
MEIYHNTRCSKSRCALDLIHNNGIEPKIIEYLKTPPTRENLVELIRMLRLKPLEVIRKNEAIFKEKFKNQTLTDDQWIDAMVAYPALIERPIVVKDGKAIIARPPEKVLEFLK